MSRKLDIICVHPGHSFSTTIWHRGLGNGLAKLGHDVVEYPLHVYLDFYRLVGTRIPTDAGVGLGAREICNLSCQPLTIDILRTEPDWVIIVTGQYIHQTIWEDLTRLRRLLGTRIALVLTESPYLDDAQEPLASYADLVTTNDLLSAERFGWEYLPPGYDDSIYYPRQVGSKYRSQVFFAGTGYEERLNLLAAVGWKELGIDLKLFGNFPDRYAATAPLRQFVQGGLFEDGNMTELAKWTCGADIAVNLHRTTANPFSGTEIEDAWSMNPRCYEAAACGTFLLTDSSRPEAREVFGDTIGYFDGPEDFKEKLLYWLSYSDERDRRAKEAQAIARGHSWNHRAALLEELMLRN